MSTDRPLVILTRRVPRTEVIGVALQLPSAPNEIEVLGAEDDVAVVGGGSFEFTFQFGVVGAATRDPWGLPTAPLRLGALISDYDLFSWQVAQLVAGPFLTFSLEGGTACRSLNGIVPLYYGSAATRTVISTSRAAVACLIGAFPHSVDPGHRITLDGVTENVCALQHFEGQPFVHIERLMEDVRARVLAVGAYQFETAILGGVITDYFRRDADFIAIPRLGHIRPRSGAIVRQAYDTISRAWTERGALYCPVTERPSLDQLSIALSP